MSMHEVLIRLAVIVSLLGVVAIMSLVFLKMAHKIGNTRKGWPLWAMVVALATWLAGTILLQIT